MFVDIIRCDEHFYINVLPCPWPNCRKGTSKDQLIDRQIPPLQGIPDIIYARKSMKAHDGGIRYYWHSDFTPLYIEVGNLFQHEYWRKVSTTQDTIYHYTDLQGLLGILNSQDLWLSDYGYMNDAQEILYGLETTRKIIQKWLDDNKSELYQYIEGIPEKLSINSAPRICLACFSLDGDSLSQWRGYASNGTGVAIGFNAANVYFPRLQEIRFNPVLYDCKTQEALIKNLISFYEQAYIEESEWNGEPIGAALADNLVRNIWELCAFFKDPAFMDEREARIVHIEHKFIYRDYLKKVLEPAARRFRISSGRLVPYCTTKDIMKYLYKTNTDKAYEIRLPIAEIIVGPQSNQQVLIKGIRELLDEYGYQSARIIQSKIPYR